jgi:capsular exopolysaccharide synthesis family protein
VVTTVVAVGISLLQEKQYSATASLLFRNPGFAQDLFGSSSTPAVTDPTREAATNEKLVGLQVVAERTAKKLRNLSYEEVAGMVETSGSGEAEVVSVTATGPDPAQAKRVANTFARQFIAFRAAADRSKLLQAKGLAEKEFERLTPAEQTEVRGRALSSGAERLGMLASLQTGNAELVQPAVLPTAPSSPKPFRNGVIAALIGLLLGIGLAFLFERLNRRLRDPEEAQEAYGLPVLGTVPESKAIMESNQGSGANELPFFENESFRMLRSSLRYFNVDRDMRSVLITSSTAGVGKSTIAWNLARTAATSAKVVLVETDLRNPTLYRQHSLKGGQGLAEILTHQVNLDEGIQSIPVATGGSDGNGGGRNLDVIIAGSLPPNPAELIESQTMAEVLSQLSERYELVVIDTAPIGVVSDAFPLLHRVDGVIIVARMDTTTRDTAERIREQLHRLEASVLGIIANGVKVRRRGRYGYGYYGGYYGQPDDHPANAKAAAKPKSEAGQGA